MPFSKLFALSNGPLTLFSLLRGGVRAGKAVLLIFGTGVSVETLLTANFCRHFNASAGVLLCANNPRVSAADVKASELVRRFGDLSPVLVDILVEAGEIAVDACRLQLPVSSTVLLTDIVSV